MLIFCKSRNIFLFSVEKIAIFELGVTISMFSHSKPYGTIAKTSKTIDTEV